MKAKNFYFLLLALGLIMASCSKQEDVNIESIDQNLELRNGATQISGLAVYSGPECDHEAEGAHFALTLVEGDLIGCLFVTVEDYECSPSGTYRETGTEYFVGTYNGEYGTFQTTYRFEAKFEGCDEGAFVGAEIFGRCQHPIVAGSGTDVFEGVTGIIFFTDDVETGEFPYRGHLRW